MHAAVHDDACVDDHTRIDSNAAPGVRDDAGVDGNARVDRWHRVRLEEITASGAASIPDETSGREPEWATVLSEPSGRAWAGAAASGVDPARARRRAWRRGDHSEQEQRPRRVLRRREWTYALQILLERD